MIQVELVYALPQEQHLLKFSVAEGVNIGQVIAQSKICEHFPQIDLNVAAVGIFGKLRTLEHRVTAGDRIEIYRSLQADPKDLRRQRAKQVRLKRHRSGAAPQK